MERSRLRAASRAVYSWFVWKGAVFAAQKEAL